MGCTLNGGSVAAILRPRVPLAAGGGVLGIRPKHVEWQPSVGRTQGPWMSSTVLETDDTGDDTLFYADVGGQAVTVLERRGRAVAVGDAIAIRFPEESVHLFVDGNRVEMEDVPVSANVV